MNTKTFFSRIVFYGMIASYMLLLLSLGLIYIHTRVILLILFLLLVIAEKKQVHLWKRLILIGALALPIYYTITKEIEFSKTYSLYRSTFMAINEKINSDDIQTLHIAFDDFKLDGTATSLAKLLHNLQGPTNSTVLPLSQSPEN